MVEPACGAIKHIRIGQRAEAAHLVGITTAGQVDDRVFLAIGVEVADQQHIVAAAAALQLRDKTAQLPDLGQAGGVPATLAVTQVGIGRIAHTRSGAAALGFKVVDNQREALAIGRRKSLGQRRAVVDGAGVAGGIALPCQAGRLVNHRHFDGVGARARVVYRTGVRHRRIQAGAHLGIERIHQVLYRCAAVVLDFHQAHHIGVQPGQRLDDLAALARKFGRVVGAAAVAGCGCAAQGAALAGQPAGGIAVEKGGEEVQHIHAGHPHIAAHRRRRGRAWVAGLHLHSGGRVDAVQPGTAGGAGGRAKVNHTGDRAQRIARAGLAVAAGIGRGVGVLQAAAIVEQQTAARLQVSQCNGLCRAGAVAVGGVLVAATGADGDLAKAGLEEVLLHRHRAVDAHQHALKALKAVTGGQWQAQQRGRDAVARALHRDGRHRSQLGQRAGGCAGTGDELGHHARHLYQVAHLGMGRQRRVDQHKDAVRGGGVVVAHRVLHEKAIAVATGDHAAGDHLGAHQRAGSASALNGVDRGGQRGRDPTTPGAHRCRRCAAAGVGRTKAEVSAVDLAVGAAIAVAQGGRGVAQGRGGAAFGGGAGAVADGVDHRAATGGGAGQRGAAAGQHHLAIGARHRQCADHIGRGQVNAAATARRLLDQQVAPGRQRGARRDGRELPGAARRRAVLHRPAADAFGRVAGIEQLDKVVLEGGAGIAAPAIDLADDHRRLGRRGQAQQGQRGH